MRNMPPRNGGVAPQQPGPQQMRGLGPGVNFMAGNVMYKQCVKVGETLSNGYQLVEVSRGKAVLDNGTDRIELEIISPSQNQSGTNTASAVQNQMNNRPNFRQPPQMNRNNQNRNQNGNNNRWNRYNGNNQAGRIR